MKKVAFALIAAIALTFSMSCGNNTKKEVNDSIKTDSVQVDSVVVDSVQLDSL